jgi:hypothetical protein
MKHLGNQEFSALLIPCDHIVAQSKAYYSHVIYSDLALLPNGNLGCLYEAGT